MKEISMQTKRLILNNLHQNDAEDLFKLQNLGPIMEILPDRFNTLSEINEIIDWLISNYNKMDGFWNRISLAIRLKGQEQLIGWVSAGELPEDGSLTELAYCLHPKHWNNGYATEACMEFLMWINEYLKIPEIYGSVSSDNFKSKKVLEKLGFRYWKDMGKSVIFRKYL